MIDSIRSFVNRIVTYCPKNLIMSANHCFKQ